MDAEINDARCPHCGNGTTLSRRCDVIGCDDGYIDEHDDDPVNYGPGEEYSVCQECHGYGVLHWCPKCGKDIRESE